ncbi:hypothetical protein [Facilibium subflavum]|uniref:hypothetical protein n=1 Tax=Facilibium subflavum TaxID=2219058 RepID=UPI000E647B0B|nr:hypothetical protein [Facilibium subflavum]
MALTWKRAKYEEAMEKAFKQLKSTGKIEPETKKELDKMTLQNVAMGDQLEKLYQTAQNDPDKAKTMYEGLQREVRSQVHTNDRQLGRIQGALGKIGQSSIAFALLDLAAEYFYARGIKGPENELDAFKKMFEKQNNQAEFNPDNQQNRNSENNQSNRAENRGPNGAENNANFELESALNNSGNNNRELSINN